MENKTEIEITKNVKCSQVFTESCAEYVLPDYNGDVRKILHTSAEIRPSGKFAVGDEVEFSGIVVYEVVYLDEENKLTSVSFSSDYDYSVKCNGENYRDSFAESAVSNYSLRLIGPRKISAKASVVGNVRIEESESLSAVGDVFEGDDMPEMMSEFIRVRRSYTSELCEREYAESVARLEGAIADEVSVVSAIADVIIDEAKLCDGGVSLRGELNLCAVIKNGDAPAYQREKIIPIEETVPFALASDTMHFVPEVTVSSLVTNINAAEFGTEIVLSVVCEMSVVGETNEECGVISDAYLKSCAVDNRYESLTYSEFCGVASSKESENGVIPRAEIEAENVREVLFLKAVPKLDAPVIDDGRIVVSGELKYSGIASVTDGEGKLGYVPLKFALPFERSLSANTTEKTDCEVRVKAHTASATFDADKLYATCLLEITSRICEEKQIKRLASSVGVPDTDEVSNSSRIVVYYPEPDESLFAVAKKYRTTVAKIADDNSLDARTVSDFDGKHSVGVKKLLIY